ncbi:GNAT family N-acetyltransferase [Actinopolymorpha pittospori]
MPDLMPAAVPSGRLRALRQPTLPVDELVLRPWRLSDAHAVVGAYQDPDIRRWHVRSMEEHEASAWLASWSRRWQEETGAGWAVTMDDMLVGRVGFRTIDLGEGVAEIGYWTLPPARGRGVATRAARAVTAWMFTHVGLHRIELSHSAVNPASCRIAEKAGFAYEGTKRRQGLHQDGWHDMHLHARLAEDEETGPVSTDR